MIDVFEYRCPEHPDSVQRFAPVEPFRVPELVFCRWVTRAAAGEIEQCGRMLTPAVLQARPV